MLFFPVPVRESFNNWGGQGGDTSIVVQRLGRGGDTLIPFSPLRLNLVLTHGIPPAFRATASTYTDNHHRVSPELISSRNCVPMAFTD